MTTALSTATMKSPISSNFGLPSWLRSPKPAPDNVAGELDADTLRKLREGLVSGCSVIF